LDAQLIRSQGGVFEVVADGVEVYAKSKTGRHARPGEVLESFKRLFPTSR
jgi:predicted Rdx family selenoprotein